MRSLYADSSVLLYAIGTEHPDREASRRVLEPNPDRRLHGSVEVLQEVLFHRMRRVDRDVALAETDQLRRLLVLHDFDVDVLDHARSLVATTSIRGRDAVHAATALRAHCDAVLTLDADFAAVPGLRVVHPRDVGR